MTPDEIKRHVQEYRQKALEGFPFKLIETTGDQALAKWQELKSAGQGIPVVLGGDDEMHPFDNLLTPFGPNGPNVPPPQPVEEILRAAASIRFPVDLAKRKKTESEAALARLKADLATNPNMPLPQIIETRNGATRTYTREETIATMEAEPHDPPLGEWPAAPGPSAGLSVAHNLVTGKPLPKVYIGLAPTGDWTAIPAFLRWGGWNDCPRAEYHVAALRTWRDRYGAELVGLSSDTINLRVATKPKTREEALALARDQYIYCADIIDQGVGTYSALAADLMAGDWWYFWWD
jgi:Domain of unknown function (DUF4253)